MKKQKNSPYPLRDIRMAHLIVVTVAFATAHLFLFLLTQFLVKPFILSGASLEQQQFFRISWVIFWVTLPLATTVFTLQKQYPLVLLKRWEAKRQKVIQAYEKRLLDAQLKDKEETAGLKETYVPVGVYYTDDPFNFLIKLKEPLYEKDGKILLPYATVNGVQVAVQEVTALTLKCFARRAITASAKTLEFKLGSENLISVRNPLFFEAKGSGGPVLWQCQGHGVERRIYLPKEYFPFADEKTIIPCKVRIHKETYGPYFGKLNDDKTMIIVQLNKDFGANDCKNKTAVVIFQYGEMPRIALPAPTVLIKDGERA